LATYISLKPTFLAPSPPCPVFFTALIPSVLSPFPYPNPARTIDPRTTQGVTPLYLRLAPHTVFTFVFWEQLKRLVAGDYE